MLKMLKTSIIGWMVNGTGVNGRGKLNCAAAAVRMTTKATDSTRTPVHQVAELARMLTRSRIVDACETSGVLEGMTRGFY